MSGDDGFLGRWARRKAEARRAEQEPPPDAVPAAPPEEPEVTPEEIAALPRIEDFTPQTDLAAFLRKGIPPALTKAALRRMWSLDPAIRDHVGEALDYAYDWNVPGGVPGNGPLLPEDDVAGMLRRLFGDEPADEGSSPSPPDGHADENAPLPAEGPNVSDEPGDDSLSPQAGRGGAA